MKIYTKTGDEGKTSLLGGSRVLKSDVRVEAYGTIDELNAFVAHLKDQFNIENVDENVVECLHRINKDLFDIGSLLALETESYKGTIAEFEPTSTVLLEKQIDKMDESLKKLRSFILPGGHPLISLCHICRTVCRRAERRVIALSQESDIDLTLVVYLNRLSDYLFTLARYVAHDYGIEEDKWHD